MYDVVIVGGGVVGCAVLRHLTLHGYTCLLLEKEPHLVSGASAGNSGMLHTVFGSRAGTLEGRCLAASQRGMREYLLREGLPYCAPGALMLAWDSHQTAAAGSGACCSATATQTVSESGAPLETQCLQRARQLMIPYLEQEGLPVSPVGGIYLAWEPAQLAALPALRDQAHKQGIEGARLLTAAQLRELEPEVSSEVVGGLLIPGEAVVDSWLTPVYMAHQATRAGAQVRCGWGVTGGHQASDGTWELHTEQGKVRGRVVVNAAGLYGDVVENIAQPSNFTIQPRRGQYVVFSKAGGALVRHLLLPVPTQTTRGVIVFPSVYGNVVVGPTAEDVPDRQRPATSPTTLHQLTQHAHKVIPALKGVKVIGSYAGLRPATEFKDYQLYANKDRCWVTVGGIRSTGVSACMGIADHVLALLKDTLTLPPSGPPQHLNPGRASYWVTERGSVVMDGVQYHVTHSLSRYGLTEERPTAKL